MFSHLSVHHKEAYREAKESQQSPVFKMKSQHHTLPVDLSSRLLSTSSHHLYPGLSHFTGQYQPPKVVAVKPLEPRHVQLSVFPYLYHSYVKMSRSVQRLEEVVEYDLVIHCSDGVVLAHKLVLAAVSHFTRALLEQCHQPVSHLVMTNTQVINMQLFIRSIYHGTLDFKNESLHGIFDMFGIPYNIKTLNQTPEEVDEDIAVDEDSEDESYIEPELHLDVGTSNMELDTEEDVDNDFSEESDDKDVEARAQELKNKIFAECGIVPKRSTSSGTKLRNTRNPSKIWKWFTKTPHLIFCKICGISIKNSGNTTNASSHLKRHPEEYTKFKIESTLAHMLETQPHNDEDENNDNEYDTMILKYFQISNKSNRKARFVTLL